MIFEYKCVAGPTIVAVRHARVRDQAVKAFEDIMNAEGWEYVGIDEFHISEPQGFLTRKRVYVPSKILVFRRAKAGSAVVEALKAQATRHDAPKLSVVPDLVELQPEDIEKTPSMKAITEKVKSIKS
jgi:hypothetical protein